MTKKRARMGRPLKPAAQRKSIRIPVLVEPPRFDLYEKCAAAEMVDISEWVRRACDDRAKSQGIE